MALLVRDYKMQERIHPNHPDFRNKWLGLKRNPYRKLFFQRHKFSNRYIKDKVVLDIPCGLGWGTSLLKCREVYGVDISKEAIEYAVNHYPGNFLVGDMKDIPFSSLFFDVIICLEGYEHVTKEIARCFLKESVRLLKSSGLIIVTTPLLNNGKHSGNPHHLHEYEREEFLKMVNVNFKTIYLDSVRSPGGEILRFVGSKK